MSQSKQTLEIRVLRKVHELALEQGNYYAELEFDSIAQALDLSPRRLKTAIQQLCHGNFLKKCGKTSVCLAKHGEVYLRENELWKEKIS